MVWTEMAGPCGLALRAGFVRTKERCQEAVFGAGTSIAFPYTALYCRGMSRSRSRGRRWSMLWLQARARGLLTMRNYLRISQGREHREQLRREAEERERERQEAASLVFVRVIRTMVMRKRFLKLKSMTFIRKIYSFGDDKTVKV